MKDIDSILRADSVNELESIVNDVNQKWSKAFMDYFNDNLLTEIKTKACKFILEDLEIFDPYSGITNNISEGFNTVFKNLLGWKQVPLDSVSLSFYFLQKFYAKEILRGFCDVGDFQLKKEFRNRLIDPSTVELPQNAVNPNDIVKQVKGEIQDYFDNNEKLKFDVIPKNATFTADTEEQTISNSSQKAIAINAIKENRIYHCAQAKAFIVDGSRGDKYTVTLHPEKCVCPALGTCWHIIAAKLSIGINDIEEKKIYNLTQLSRNVRKRPNKNAGKKKTKTNR